MIMRSREANYDVGTPSCHDQKGYDSVHRALQDNIYQCLALF